MYQSGSDTTWHDITSLTHAPHSTWQENTYSINVGRKTIYIMECDESGDKPVELAFLDVYGNIQKHM